MQKQLHHGNEYFFIHIPPINTLSSLAIDSVSSFVFSISRRTLDFSTLDFSTLDFSTLDFSTLDFSTLFSISRLTISIFSIDSSFASSTRHFQNETLFCNAVQIQNLFSCFQEAGVPTCVEKGSMWTNSHFIASYATDVVTLTSCPTFDISRSPSLMSGGEDRIPPIGWLVGSLDICFAGREMR